MSETKPEIHRCKDCGFLAKRSTHPFPNDTNRRIEPISSDEGTLGLISRLLDTVVTPIHHIH